MKKNLIFLALILSSLCLAETPKPSFEADAAALAKDLKLGLVKQLTEKMQTQGAVPALEFCHVNVAALAKTAAGERLSRYEFGRTSHKLRSTKNAPAEWMFPYLDQFKTTSLKSPAQPVVHQFEDGKKAFLDPLYVGPQCLTCHGSLSKELNTKVQALYPQDQAVGFKLGEFRGMIWVKEK